MEWFKHMSGSHDEADYSDAWHRFGDAAPTIFWTVCEVYAENFSKTKDGWFTISLFNFERNLRRKWKKIEEILEFFQQRERIYFKKDSESVSICIPKFIDLSSNWTKRAKITPTEAPQEEPTEAPTAIEEEEEEEKKKNKIKRKNKAAKPPPPPEIKYLDSVYLTETEYKKLQEVLGQKSLDIGIEKLDYSITVKGGKYKDHYKTLLNWKKRGYLDGDTNTSANEHKPYYQSKFRGTGQRQPTELPADVLADIAEINRLQAKKTASGTGTENAG